MLYGVGPNRPIQDSACFRNALKCVTFLISSFVIISAKQTLKIPLIENISSGISIQNRSVELEFQAVTGLCRRNETHHERDDEFKYVGKREKIIGLVI